MGTPIETDFIPSTNIEFQTTGYEVFKLCSLFSLYDESNVRDTENLTENTMRFRMISCTTKLLLLERLKNQLRTSLCEAYEMEGINNYTDVWRITPDEFKRSLRNFGADPVVICPIQKFVPSHDSSMDIVPSQDATAMNRSVAGGFEVFPFDNLCAVLECLSASLTFRGICYTDDDFMFFLTALCAISLDSGIRADKVNFAIILGNIKSCVQCIFEGISDDYYKNQFEVISSHLKLVCKSNALNCIVIANILNAFPSERSKGIVALLTYSCLTNIIYKTGNPIAVEMQDIIQMLGSVIKVKWTEEKFQDMYDFLCLLELCISAIKTDKREEFENTSKLLSDLTYKIRSSMESVDLQRLKSLIDGLRQKCDYFSQNINFRQPTLLRYYRQPVVEEPMGDSRNWNDDSSAASFSVPEDVDLDLDISI